MMKKLSLFLLAFTAVLFTQCKKEPLEQNQNTESKMIPVRFELPVDNGGKTDFSDFLNGNENATIKWNDVETVYLAIPNIPVQDPTEGLYTLGCAQLVPLRGEEQDGKMVFHGEVEIKELGGCKCTLYYFGNNGTMSDGETSNIKITKGDRFYYNVDHEVNTEISMSFNNQDGSRNTLGNYHIASVEVSIEAVTEESGTNPDTGEVMYKLVSYSISADSPVFKSETAIAYMDLDGVTELNGTAAVTSVALQWNEDAMKYTITPTFATEETPLTISSEATSESFITLWQTGGEDNPTTLTCNNGNYYTFQNGVKRNTVYFERHNGELSPLTWTNP